MWGHFCFMPWRKFTEEGAQGPHEAYEPEYREGWLVESMTHGLCGKQKASEVIARMPGESPFEDIQCRLYIPECIEQAKARYRGQPDSDS